MKIQNIVRWCNFSLIILLTSSCMRLVESMPTPPLISHTLVPANIVPTLTVVSTETPIPSPMIVPTLAENDANKRLFDLLTNNGGCRLPCLWSIVPGKNTYQDAQAILVPLSAISELVNFTFDGGAIFPMYTDGDYILAINAGFNVNPLSSKKIVTRLGFQARVLEKVDNGFVDVFDSPFFIKQLEYYMLPNILTEYGNPTSVMLSTMAKIPSSGVKGGFKVLLLYPEQGILVNYTMQMQIANKNIMGCPLNSHVEFELYPPGHAEFFFDISDSSGWSEVIQNTYKPIEEVTSITKDNFYQIFSQQTDKCILTPATLWPVPD